MKNVIIPKATRVQRKHQYIKTDGGRAEAGFIPHRTAKAWDCVARTIAIASGRPYSKVWHELALVNFHDNRRKIAAYTADLGVWTDKKEFLSYMTRLGFVEISIWHNEEPTFNQIKDTVASEGTFFVRIYNHTFALKDGIIYDMYNPVGSGRTKVIQLWKLESPE